ncbi:hypothetical protein MRX96_029965 [Rhipicephalus microplus]
MWASEQPGRLRLRWTSVQRATTCRRCRHGSSTIDCISLPAHASTHLLWSATWRLRCPGLYMRSSGNPLSLVTVAPSTCGSQIARSSIIFSSSSACCISAGDVGLGTTGATATALDQRAKSDHVPTLPTRIFDYRLHQLTGTCIHPSALERHLASALSETIYAFLRKPPLTGHGGTVDMRLTNCPFIYNFQFVFGLLHQRRRCGPRNNRGDCDCAGPACTQRPRADAADTDLRLSTASAYRHMHPPICPGAPPGVCAVRDYICVPQETPLSLGTVAPSTCGSQIARSSIIFSSSSACCISAGDVGLGNTGATATALDQRAKSDQVPTLPTRIFDYRLHQLTGTCIHPSALERHLGSALSGTIYAFLRKPPVTGYGATVDMRLTNCPFIYIFQFVFGLLHSAGDGGLGTTGATVTALDQRAKSDHVPTLPTRIFFDYRLHHLTGTCIHPSALKRHLASALSWTIYAFLAKPPRRPERKRVAVCPASCTNKLRLSQRDVLDTSSPDVGADGDDSLDGMVPRHDLRTIVNTVSVPNGWARLDALDFDDVVFATTSVKKEPFALLPERVLMFAMDCADIVTARLYFRGKERKDVPIRSVKEAAKTFRYSDSAILCKGAMGRAEFDNNYSKDITCHLKHSVDVVYGIVLSRSCSGIVSKEGLSSSTTESTGA